MRFEIPFDMYGKFNELIKPLLSSLILLALIHFKVENMPQF